VPRGRGARPCGSARSDVAARNYGGYTRANVAHLEGRYVAPAGLHVGGCHQRLSHDLRWTTPRRASRSRKGTARMPAHATRTSLPPRRTTVHELCHGRRGRHPADHVSRPGERNRPRADHDVVESERMQFTPASAPIVLRRVTDRIPQLGFLRPGAPIRLLPPRAEAVAPAFGFFASAPQLPRPRIQGLPRRRACRW